MINLLYVTKIENVQRVGIFNVLNVESGDSYDHLGILASYDTITHELHFLGVIPYVNVNGSKVNDTEYVEIIDTVYYAVVGLHPYTKTKGPSLYICNPGTYEFDENVDPVLINNDYNMRNIIIKANNRNDPTAIGINYHLGGYKDDWSAGCWTTPYEYFNPWISQFVMGTPFVIFKDSEMYVTETTIFERISKLKNSKVIASSIKVFREYVKNVENLLKEVKQNVK